MQDVLEKTVRAPDSVPDGGDERNERAWLSRVLHNLFIDRLRRRTSRREQPIVEDPVAEPPAPRAWWEELGEREIRAQLARLPDEQRVTFELFAFAGRSYEEIAAELGIAKATVGTRILRARQKLRLLLDEECRDD